MVVPLTTGASDLMSPSQGCNRREDLFRASLAPGQKPIMLRAVLVPDGRCRAGAALPRAALPVLPCRFSAPVHPALLAPHAARPHAARPHTARLRPRQAACRSAAEVKASA